MTSPAHILNREIIDDLKAILGIGFNEIVDEQIVQADVYLRELEMALNRNEPEDAVRCAHALKSSAGQIGLQGIHALAKELETTCKADAVKGEVSRNARDLQQAIAGELPEALRNLLGYIRGDAS